MSNTNKCLISQDNSTLQIPYEDYMTLMEKAQQGQRMQEAKTSVIANLKNFLSGESQVDAIVNKVKAAPVAPPVAVPKAPQPEPVPEKVAIEFEADTSVREIHQPVKEVKEPVATTKNSAPKARTMGETMNVPPIKNDISLHFNKLDESGRLFSVFKQYYTCLNDTCGGTVRVTMKDGFCSLWNYDEWEEFAFIDIDEGHLRVSVDPRYTGVMQSLNFCEVPRLLSSRRNLVSVHIDDLCNTMLELLVKAFTEVGLTAS